MSQVFCKKCNTDIGWMYEYTKNDDQRYKEGKFVLEVECLTSERAEKFHGRKICLSVMKVAI